MFDVPVSQHLGGGGGEKWGGEGEGGQANAGHLCRKL